MIKKFIAGLMAVSMIFSFCACVKKEDNEKVDANLSVSKQEMTEKETTDEAPITVREISDANVGDHIIFGAYEQDNNMSNGKEEIVWLVLDKQEDKILVISKYALDWQPYLEYTWADSAMRRWLNEEFINNAFNSTEKSRIAVTDIAAKRNQKYDISAGRNTQDKVFLLSIDEAKIYFSSDNERVCSPTAYVESIGRRGDCWWWLRSPGDVKGKFAGVFIDGTVDERGQSCDDIKNAVRPAMWINL